MTQPAHEFRRNRQRYWLKRFNPDATFLVLRPFCANGRALAEGEIFDKASVPQRTLRILYESRRLEQVVNGDAESVSSDLQNLPHLELLHVGRGKWVVIDGVGFRHSEPMKKQEAECAMARILSHAGSDFRADRAAQLGR